MRNFIVLGLVLGSFSAFADISEFERGFLAGKETCHVDVAPTMGYVCRVPTTSSYSVESGVGRTKAEALLRVKPDHLGEAYESGRPPVCTQF